MKSMEEQNNKKYHRANHRGITASKGVCPGQTERDAEPVRLNKYLSDAGICSRRQADRYVEEGRITIDGRLAQMGEKVLPTQTICVDGKPVGKTTEKVLLLFYKPRGIVCSTKKQRQEITVTEYLEYPVRIYPVGRLDRESEGLLLMTNQGDLVNRIMRAGNYHEKEYLVTVDRPLTEKVLRGLAGGVPILGTVTRPCKVYKTGEKSFRIILTQGLNRQIRRMCEYFGYQVTELKRIRIMNLTLDGLRPGEYRDIRPEEWEELQKRIEHSSNETVTGGRYGYSPAADERSGKKGGVGERISYRVSRHQHGGDWKSGIPAGPAEAGGARD